MDTEQIAQITVKGTSEGMDKVKSDLDGVAKSQDNLAQSSAAVATVTETTAKKHLDASSAYDKLHNSLDVAAGSTEAFAKRATLINTALDQGHITSAQAAADLALLAERYPKAAQAQSSFNSIIDAGRGALLGYAAGIGPIGAVLGSFGPWGVAAAAGIGLVSAALQAASENAKKFGEQSLQIRSFADATGITTTEVRGLAEAGEKAGLGADIMKIAFERLTVNLAETRTRTGTLFESIQAINPALANEIANTRSGAEAWDLLARAVSSTADATLKAQIAKAAFGRGGVELIPALAQTNGAGGIKEYSDELQRATGISDELTRSTAKQLAEIESLKRTATDIYSSIYSDDVLRRMKAAAEFQVQIAKAAKEAASMPGGATAQWQNPFIQETNRSAGVVSSPIPGGAGGSGITADTSAIAAQIAAITAQATATDKLTKSRLDDAQAAQAQANQSAQMIALLGGAATGEETYQAKVDALTAAFLANKFGASDSADAIDKYNRALHGDTAAVLQSLHDELRVVQATTDQGKLAAQYRKDYNDALRSHSDEDATQIATAKMAISMAQAAKSALEWQQTMLGIGPVAEQLAASAQAMADSYQRAANAAVEAANGVQAAANGDFGAGSALGGFGSNNSSTVAAGQQFTSGIDWLGGFARQQIAQTSEQAANYGLATGGLSAAIAAVMRQPTGIADPFFATGGGVPYAATDQSKMSTIQTLYDLKNSQTNDNATKVANLNEELAWLNRQPETIARDQMIAQLTQSIDQLNKSTNTLNSTNQDLLSPYYSQDPRTSHIGFRSQGMAGGGYVDVPGSPSANDNMIATIPVASGERIYVDPMSSRRGAGGGTTISISMPITIQGSASRDDVGRTLYQAGQNIARQLAATSR
jgi:hypothetical protein